MHEKNSWLLSNGTPLYYTTGGKRTCMSQIFRVPFDHLLIHFLVMWNIHNKMHVSSMKIHENPRCPSIYPSKSESSFHSSMKIHPFHENPRVLHRMSPIFSHIFRSHPFPAVRWNPSAATTAPLEGADGAFAVALGIAEAAAGDVDEGVLPGVHRSVPARSIPSGKLT